MFRRKNETHIHMNISDFAERLLVLYCKHIGEINGWTEQHSRYEFFKFQILMHIDSMDAKKYKKGHTDSAAEVIIVGTLFRDLSDDINSFLYDYYKNLSRFNDAMTKVVVASVKAGMTEDRKTQATEMAFKMGLEMINEEFSKYREFSEAAIRLHMEFVEKGIQ